MHAYIVYEAFPKTFILQKRRHLYVVDMSNIGCNRHIDNTHVRLDHTSRSNHDDIFLKPKRLEENTEHRHPSHAVTVKIS